MPPMMGDGIGGPAGPPPMPPTATPASSSGPTFAGLAGKPAPGAGASPSAGSSQISGALVRLGMEIDQALKLLAQAAPQLADWVDKTTQELRSQIGVAIQSGVPSSSTPQGQGNFPGGGGNL